MENDERSKKPNRNERHTRVIRAKIRQARNELGMTQRDFVERMGQLRPTTVPYRNPVQSRLAKWEGGEGFPTGQDLVIIADLTGKSLRYWCDDTITDPNDERAVAAPPRPRTADEQALDMLVSQLGVAEVVRRVIWYQSAADPQSQPLRGQAAVVPPAALLPPNHDNPVAGQTKRKK